MRDTQRRFLSRRVNPVLLLLIVMALVALVFQLAPQPEKEPQKESSAFQMAYDRAYAARMFAQNDLLQREGIRESDIVGDHYGFSLGETVAYRVAFAYMKGAEQKVWGYQISVDDALRCRIEQSSEKLGQKLLSIEDTMADAGSTAQ